MLITSTWIFNIIICISAISFEIPMEDITDDMVEGYEQIYQAGIPGPKSYDDNIVIIGAGPSGIHMAHLLKEKGYRNVEILEKSDRLGGKSMSVNYRGAVHEMGTCFLSADYEVNVLDLVKKFTNNTLIAPPIASVWSKRTPNGGSLTQYIFGGLMMKYPNMTNVQLRQFYLLKIQTYIRLHIKLFGTYSGELMSEPSQKIKDKISGTFMDFLIRNGLDDLKDLFTSSYTLQGYGRLDEVPALYGLMWNTPKLMTGIVKFLNGKKGGLFVLSMGWESLWKAIVKSTNIKVTYNVDLRYIYNNEDTTDFYGKTNKIHLYYKINKGKLIIKSYDFLIWSPSASNILPLTGGIEMKEAKRLFSNTVNAYYTTSLVDSSTTKRSLSPVDWFYDNIYSKKEMDVWASRDSYSALRGIFGETYAKSKTITGDDGNKNKRTSIFYQYSQNKPDSAQLQKILTNHLKHYGATNIKTVQQSIWPYFERFNQKNTEDGYHWRVLELQGKHNVWFIGSSVSFESVKSVVEYNQLLVSRMMKPSLVHITK